MNPPAKSRPRGGRQRTKVSRSRAGLVLVLPLAIFLLIVFAAPLAKILSLSVDDNDVAGIWPRVSERLHGWDRTVPDELTFAALAEDMRASQKAKTTALVARRVNYALPGGRTLVSSTARRIAEMNPPPPSWKVAFLQIDPAWGTLQTWQTLYQASGPVSSFYLLTAFDRSIDAAGHIVHAPPESSVYLGILERTFGIALLVTVICLLLAFPVAYFLAHGPKAWRGLVMALVLLPLWTSLMVRTAAWVVLLQDQGLINKALMALHVIGAPLELIFHRTGVLVAMIHVSLPYMVLPLYATMAGIKPDFMRAAISMGAKPSVAFRRIYLPLTAPGMAAGCLLVFIMSLGYYITPALVGGASDQMVSYFIAFYTSESVNWGLAGALAVILLAATSVLYLVYSKIAGTPGASLV